MLWDNILYLSHSKLFPGSEMLLAETHFELWWFFSIYILNTFFKKLSSISSFLYWIYWGNIGPISSLIIASVSTVLFLKEPPKPGVESPNSIIYFYFLKHPLTVTFFILFESFSDWFLTSLMKRLHCISARAL